jgi:hypothetical protein
LDIPKYADELSRTGESDFLPDQNFQFARMNSMVPNSLKRRIRAITQ